MPRTVRTVYAYELHGHDSEGPLDYRAYFDALSKLPPRQRSYALSDDSEQVVAIPEIRVSESRFQLRFVSGREGDPAVFYDLVTGSERTAAPLRNEMPIHSSWFVIDTASRIVIQERRRPGVPLNDAVSALVAIGRERKLAQNPTLTLHPVLRSSFAGDIDELERIRSASVLVSQPNMSWTKSVNSIIADLGQESHGGSAELTVVSRPKESLDKNNGIVGEIKEMARVDYSAMRSAKVVGYRPGDDRPTTISTRKHAQRREVNVPDGATRADEQAAVLTGAEAFMDELAETRHAED